MTMIILDLAPNPNCDAVDMRIFHDLGPAQSLSQVCLERLPGVPAWYDVTGWTAEGTSCPALLHKVDDSGEGVAFLLHGGDAGLRLRPVGHEAPWRIDDPQQWGEPFIIMSDLKDVRCHREASEPIRRHVSAHV